VVESDGLLNRCRLNPYLGFESRSLRLLFALAGRLFVCLFIIASCFPGAARASEDPTTQYLATRRASNWRRDVTPEIIAKDPMAYAGITLEIEGKLLGIMQSDEASPSIALSTNDYGTIHLRMSRRPDWLDAGSRVRVLVIIPPLNSEYENVVVGLPEMEVLAVATASEVSAIEMRELQKMKRVQKISAAKPHATTPSALAFSKATSQPSIATPPRMKRTERAGSSLSSRSSNARAASNKGKTLQQIVAEGLSAEGARVFPMYKNFIANHNKRLTEQKAGDIAYAVLKFSEKMDMDPRLMVALIIAESDFRPEITSSAGAMGIAQLMPDEVQRLGLTNPYDPVQNIAGSVFLLKERLNKYSGSGDFKDANMQHIILAIASYNAGMGAVKKYNGVPPYRETQNYVRKIEQIYRQLTAGDN
jgi:soluble lytic murein transglycosylase-like protein